MRNVREIYGLKKTTGDVGIEIEVEGRKLPQELARFWKCEHDGSLRGESMEYVLRKPVPLAKVDDALLHLRAAYEDHGTVVSKDTTRTSVHVHINVQELNMVQVFNFVTLYHAMEDLIVKFCGESREGNLFCLRMKDAEYARIAYRQAIRNARWDVLNSDKIRYAALNVASLAKYGSLELRCMRGTDDWSLISQWVKMLWRIREAAVQYASPDVIVETLSMEGDREFLHQVMGEFSEDLITPDAENTIRKGIRRIQDVCYDVDWDLVKKEQPQDDEFLGLLIEKGEQKAAEVRGGFQWEPAHHINLDMDAADPRRMEPEPEPEPVPAPPPPRPVEDLAAAWQRLPLQDKMRVRELARVRYANDVAVALEKFLEER